MKHLLLGFSLFFVFSAQASLEVSLVEIAGQIEDRYTSLKTCTETLSLKLASKNIKDAQLQWFECRSLWESGEAHTFGPATLEGYDEKMDSWPLDVSSIDQLIKNQEIKRLDDILNLDPSLRGFHAVEYILFERPEQIELAFLFAEDLRENAHGLLRDWMKFQNDFFEREEDSLYPVTNDAIQEILDGVIESLTEVAEAKLLDPIYNNDVRLIESSFAKNAMLDFLANVQGPYDLLKPLLAHSKHRQEVSERFEIVLQQMKDIGSYEEAFHNTERHLEIEVISANLMELTALIESELKSEWP